MHSRCSPEIVGRFQIDYQSVSLCIAEIYPTPKIYFIEEGPSPAYITCNYFKERSTHFFINMYALIGSKFGSVWKKKKSFKIDIKWILPGQISIYSRGKPLYKKFIHLWWKSFYLYKKSPEILLFSWKSCTLFKRVCYPLRLLKENI